MEDDVIIRGGGQVEIRLQELEIRLPRYDAETLFLLGLKRLGWDTERQSGLRVGDRDPTAMPERRARDEIERLRANGVQIGIDIVHRPLLLGPWGDETTAMETTERAGRESTGGSPVTGERRFTKEKASGPTKQVAKANAKRAPKRVDAAFATPTLEDIVLFDDPVEQLLYEARHLYLMTVPTSQRKEWPWREFDVLPTFMRDITEHAGQVSRQQIVSAIVDVVSNRMINVNSRQPRPFRVGGGDDGKPIVTRSDGAMAMRANVSHGTPAARRVMWWRLPDSSIVFARLATHDDVYMPER